MRRPLVGVAICYGCGIVAGSFWESCPPGGILGLFGVTAFFCCLTALRGRRKLTNVILGISLFLAGGFTYSLTVPRDDGIHLVSFLGEEAGKDATLTGKVIACERWRSRVEMLRLEARLLEEGGRSSPVRGKVEVRCRPSGKSSAVAPEEAGEESGPRIGDVVRVRGRLFALVGENGGGRSVRGSAEQGGSDNGWSAYLRREGVEAVMEGGILEEIRERGRGGRYAIECLRERMERGITRDYREPQASFLAAILLGKRRGIPRERRETFQKTGLAHVLAISGLHVWIVLGTFVSFLVLLRIPERVIPILAIPALAFLTFLTGARPPVVRAAIMASIILAGWLLQRPADGANSLALASLVILVVSPRALFSLGFQLSFTAVCSLLTLGPRLRRLVPVRSGWRKIVCHAVLTVLAAQIGVLPLVAYHFGIIPLLALPANLILVPLVGPIVALGFVGCLGGMVFPPAFRLLQTVEELLVTLFLAIVRHIAEIPASTVLVSRFPLAFVFAYYVLLIFLAVFLDRKYAEKRRTEPRSP